MKQKKPFEIAPVVCAAGENYIICVPVPTTVLMSVFVNDEEYINDNCGVKISSCYVQKFVIPQSILDAAKAYTVTYEIIYREAYCSRKEPPVRKTFRFFPITKDREINIYHLSDVHGKKRAAIKAGSYFQEDLDLLVLNGDISSSTQTVNESMLPLRIAYAITKGEKPCVITRGNHDLRGKYAEQIDAFYPLDNGRFYYSVRLGPIWCLVLDCGEDKDDGHREYAGTVAFHKYRLKETEFLRKIVSSGEAGSAYYKIVISHIPFMHTDYDPAKKVHEFDIEQDTYGEWVRLINDHIRPDIGLFGHVHKTDVVLSHGKYNEKGFLSPMILGGKPMETDVIGCAVTLNDSAADVVFNGADLKAIQSFSIPIDH